MFYDWMVRDFFKYLADHANGIVYAPGTYEMIFLGMEWKSRAESAYGRAVKACEYEAGKLGYAAGAEWQKIFGLNIPVG